MWWLAVSVALGVPIDEQAVRGLVAEVAPRVEAVAGRRLVAVPSVRVTDRAGALAGLLEPPVVLGPEGAVPVPFGPSRRAHATEVLAHAMAVYVPATEEILVVREGVRDLFLASGLPPHQVAELVRCTLAHELTHALQHQHGVTPTGDAELAIGHLILMEGHAAVVAQQVCRPAHPQAAAVLDAASLGDVPSSLTAADPIQYAWGSLLVDALLAEGDDAVWRALAADPPTRTEVLAAVAPALTPAWADPAPLDATAAAYGWAGRAAPTSPHAALAALLGGAPPPTDAGLALLAPNGGALAAFRFVDADGPMQVLRARLEAVKAWRSGLRTLARGIGAPTRVEGVPFRPLHKRKGVDAAIAIRVEGATGAHREIWVATPHVLVLLAADEPGPGDPLVARSLADLLAALPAEASGSVGTGWYDADAPLDAGPSWAYRLQQAARLQAEGAADICAPFAGVAEDASDGLRRAAALCAGVAGPEEAP